jgi:hypothetical protein
MYHEALIAYLEYLSWVDAFGEPPGQRARSAVDVVRYVASSSLAHEFSVGVSLGGT